jgi:multidrug transporter EmrE-like cation transporter
MDTILIISFMNILRRNKISIAYPIIKILSIIFVVIYGTLIFHETITDTQLLGIIFGIIAVYLLL